MEKDGNKLWRLIEALSGPEGKATQITLEKDGNLLTVKATADLLIKQYAAVSNIEVDPEKKIQIRRNTKNLKETPTDQERDLMNKSFTQHELERALQDLKLKKSPGENGVTNEMIQHLGKNMKKKVLQLYNTTWTTGNIPIYKQGKDKKKPESYQPVSLLNCLGKTMERIVNTRMTWYLEKNNILVEEQTGLRRGRCTEDQIALIAQDIEDGFQEKKHTVVVWIDMAKAFDRVWRDGLLFKLKDNGITRNMFKWTEQYLQNRKARVRTQHFKSRTQNMKHRVPQGGILSPTLFSMFMNDIQTILPKGVYGAMYADDMGNRGIHWNRTGASTTGTRGPKNVDRKMPDENKP
ncbi:RNA-directed DNA polymerase from mobile element jockey [Elysia marginata]|uniref:RNA-directed DNA polymerase from mobile element jockey n=1 Tax=Elysia marginata TaxID=1093978 RepID=A0AAV4FS41_9GAST|nr:RNA-directed DNA polymerase from mobile element jockey [Elysia marginata]